MVFTDNIQRPETVGGAGGDMEVGARRRDKEVLSPPVAGRHRGVTACCQLIRELLPQKQTRNTGSGAIKRKRADRTLIME